MLREMGLVALIRINNTRWGNKENRAVLDWFTIMPQNLFQEENKTFQTCVKVEFKIKTTISISKTAISEKYFGHLWMVN